MKTAGRCSADSLRTAYDEVREALDNPDFVLKEAPFTGEIVETMRRLPRVDIPDMPDRIVAATALYLSVPLISRDGRSLISYKMSLEGGCVSHTR